MSEAALRSPIGLDCCSCCLDLANRAEPEDNNPASPTSPSGHLRALRERLEVLEDPDRLNRMMRQDSLEPVLRDPNYLLDQGLCDGTIDQTMLSILLFFHRWVPLLLLFFMNSNFFLNVDRSSLLT